MLEKKWTMLLMYSKNNPVMKSNSRPVTLAILLVVAVVIALYFIIRSTVKTQNRETLLQLNNPIDAQEKVLISLAEATRRNGADTVTARIVVDCNSADRQRFDSLLDLLSSTISPAELSELSTLFFKCGSFFADTKSVMAIKLQREVEILAEYAELREKINNQNLSVDTKIAAWKNLSEAELKTAEYFNQLVVLQGTIIAELQSGKKPTAPTIVDALSKVASVRGQMQVLSQQIEIYKTEALTL